MHWSRIAHRAMVTGALGAGLCLLPAAPAYAGAWTLPEGTGQVIATPLYSDSGKGFDANGDVADIPDYRKAELYVLLEYGLTDDVTLVAKPSLTNLSIEGAGDSGGIGYTELGGRYRVYARGETVVSLQALARVPGEKRRSNLAQVGGDTMEYDLRGLVGRSFRLGGAKAFVDMQAGYRLRSGRPPNEFHIDATLGVDVGRKTQILAQVFNTVSDGRGIGAFTDYRYHNAQLSVVQTIAPNMSLQIGALGTIAGKNALRERGVFAGWWVRF